MEPMRASILTIGTEVSTGQIVNSNAAWIANQLIDLKINPVWHLTVADDEREILDAMDCAAARSQLLFITGGLGPTTDDISRLVVNRWWGDELCYHANSWENIQTRFQSLGITPPESNRQQCYFPKSAQVLDNPVGTAAAFYMQRKDLQLWCLPGPPEEIKAIWSKHLQTPLLKLGQVSDSYRLFRWHLIGNSESALGELVESTIAGSSLLSGYRPHAPYIEVKIWCRHSQLLRNQAWLDKLNAALSPWLISRDDEDCLDHLLERIQDYRRILVCDHGTAGAFAHRLGQARQKFIALGIQLDIHTHFALNEAEVKPFYSLDNHDLVLSIDAVKADGSWSVHWHSAHSSRLQTLRLPFRRDPRRFDRESKFMSEMSLANWSKALSGELYV